MHTVRNLALRWSIYKGAADAPFCKSAETVIAPFDKAAGAVDAPPLTKLLGPWMRLLCCLAGARPPLFDKAAGAVDAPPLLSCRSPWVYITFAPTLVPVFRRHNKLS